MVGSANALLNTYSIGPGDVGVVDVIVHSGNNWISSISGSVSSVLGSVEMGGLSGNSIQLSHGTKVIYLSKTS